MDLNYCQNKMPELGIGIYAHCDFLRPSGVCDKTGKHHSDVETCPWVRSNVAKTLSYDASFHASLTRLYKFMPAAHEDRPL